MTRTQGSRTRLLRSGLTMLVAGGTLAVGLTGAIFTDSDSAAANALTTGTVDISDGDAAAMFSTGVMAPGDVREGTVTVSNAGSLELRYAMDSITTDVDGKSLDGQLDLTVWAEADEAVGTADTCEHVNRPTTALYGPNVLGDTTVVNILGDSTQGAQVGDRTLAAAANELICFHVILPSETGNTFQDATTTATFGFEAEQTSNNA